jgi:hypothetical protein
MSKYFSLILDLIICINGFGLELFPVLDLPKVSGFKPFTGNVEVLLPDGKKGKYSAQFLLKHVNLDNRMGHWKIVILLPRLTRKDVPDGSEIIVTKDIASRLMHIR